MGRAFVAGATGLTGREVVRELRQRGYETIAHVRPDSAQLSRWRAHFGELGAEVDTTPWDREAMSARLGELSPDVVFFLIGTTRKRMKALDDPAQGSYETVDYGLASLLLAACQDASLGQTRYVYLSAMGVSASAPGAYMQVRWRMEQELRASGQPYTIARPGFILGARDEERPLEALGGGVSDAFFGVLGALGARKLEARFSSFRAPELGRALVEAGLDAACQGRILEPEDLR